MQNLLWHGRPAHETRARCPCHTCTRGVAQESHHTKNLCESRESTHSNHSIPSIQPPESRRPRQTGTNSSRARRRRHPPARPQARANDNAPSRPNRGGATRPAAATPIGVVGARVGCVRQEAPCSPPRDGRDSTLSEADHSPACRERNLRRRVHRARCSPNTSTPDEKPG